VGLSGGVEVGIYKLDEIFREVRTLKIADDRTLREELLARVRVHNWVARQRQDELTAVLLREYRSFCSKIKK
jgi:hypothetical protein